MEYVLGSVRDNSPLNPIHNSYRIDTPSLDQIWTQPSHTMRLNPLSFGLLFRLVLTVLIRIVHTTTCPRNNVIRNHSRVRSTIHPCVYRKRMPMRSIDWVTTNMLIGRLPSFSRLIDVFCPLVIPNSHLHSQPPSSFPTPILIMHPHPHSQLDHHVYKRLSS